MKSICLNCLVELQKYKNSDKEYLMRKYIQDRLNKSFDVYQEELEHSIEFLTKKHEKSVLKRITK